MIEWYARNVESWLMWCFGYGGSKREGEEVVGDVTML